MRPEDETRFWEEIGNKDGISRRDVTVRLPDELADWVEERAAGAAWPVGVIVQFALEMWRERIDEAERRDADGEDAARRLEEALG